MSHPRILLVEDDHSFGYILSEYLGMQEMNVDWVKSAEEAEAMLQQYVYDLAILDVMLPGDNGFELGSQLQQQFEELPFLYLSAKSLKVDQLKGFQLGAIDYLTKPIDEELLVAKIRALLHRQTQPQPMASYAIGEYEFHPRQFQLTWKGKETRLTAREAELLKLLCEHRGELLPRKLALQRIWGATDEFSRKSMDVFISRLRKALAHDSSVRIENVHGKGFILWG